MDSTCPLFYKSSSPFTNPLLTVLRVPNTIVITVTFMFYSFFNSLARSKYLSFCSIYFNFNQPGQSPQFIVFSFLNWLLLRLVVWPIVVDPFVAQNPCGVYVSRCLGQILGCVYTIFFHMVKFQFLAQFQVDYRAYPVTSSLILFLCLFAAFTYYMIDRFYSVTT